jgi:hypothetical protein
MIGDLTLKPTRLRRSTGSRFLSYLLLFLISYGSSTEIFHHHGLAASPRPAANVGTTVSDNGQNTSSTKTPLERDCLICQFQRGLSSTAIFVPFLVVAPTHIHFSISSRPVSQNSTFTSASRGRAPPFTL